MFVASDNSIGSCLGSVGSDIYYVGSKEDAGIGFGAGFLDSIRLLDSIRWTILAKESCSFSFVPAWLPSSNEEG